MLTSATTSGSKSSTHSSLEDMHSNMSSSVHTKRTYGVPFDNNKIDNSNTPISSGSHQSKSIQKEKEDTHCITIDTDEDDIDTPIHSSGHQSRSIQKQKQVTHPSMSVDAEDDTDFSHSTDSYVEIVEKPSEDAEAELGQLSCQILQKEIETYTVIPSTEQLAQD